MYKLSNVIGLFGLITFFGIFQRKQFRDKLIVITLQMSVQNNFAIFQRAVYSNLFQREVNFFPFKERKSP